jgi:hypothetical protein
VHKKAWRYSKPCPSTDKSEIKKILINILAARNYPVFSFFRMSQKQLVIVILNSIVVIDNAVVGRQN